MKKIILLIIVCLVLLGASPAWSATYYVDWAGGDDTCDGSAQQTKAEDAAAENDGTCSWKRAPGMQGCLRTDDNDNPCRVRAAATTNGDTIVFKGGVTWPKEAFSFDWYFGNSTTFTVDATWYTGEAWARPIFDLEDTEPTASPETTTTVMRAYGTGNTVNNIEFKRVAQLHGVTNGYKAAFLGIGAGSLGGIVSNCYFHAWSHGAVEKATDANPLCLGTVGTPLVEKGAWTSGANYVIDDWVTYEGENYVCKANINNSTTIPPSDMGDGGHFRVTHSDCYVWTGGVDAGKRAADNSVLVSMAAIAAGPDFDSKLFNNVWDGSVSGSDMAQAFKGSWGHVYNNYIGDIGNGVIVTNLGYVWGNTFKNIAKSTANTICSGYPLASSPMTALCTAIPLRPTGCNTLFIITLLTDRAAGRT